MTNPAERLLNIFDRWQDETGPTEQRREIRSDEGTRDHVEAMRCLAAMPEFIDELEQAGYRVQRYRNIFPKWVHALVVYPQGWQRQANHDVLYTTHMMDLLEGLADDIHQLRPPMAPDALRDAEAFLQEVDDLATADEGLPEDLSRYIHRLVQHLRNCIEDYEKVGTFEVREAFERLWVAVMAAEGMSSGENKSHWSKLKDTIYKPAMASFLGAIPHTAVQVIAQIGQSAS